jgi:hypothetical protein
MQKKELPTKIYPVFKDVAKNLSRQDLHNNDAIGIAPPFLPPRFIPQNLG